MASNYYENNPFLATIAEQARTLTPIPSVAQAKQANLAEIRKQKMATLQPQAAVEQSNIEYLQSLGIGEESLDTGFFPAARSSIIQSAGNIANMGRNIWNRGVDAVEADSSNRFENPAYTEQWANPAVAAKMAGYNPTPYNAIMGQAGKQVAKGNYWEAAKTVAPYLPETLGGSAGAITEIAAGTLLAPATGGGSMGVVFANIASKAPRLASVLSKTYQGAKEISLYSTAQANRIAEEYYKETGDLKSVGDVARDVAVAGVLGKLDANIFMSAAKSGTVGTLQKTTAELLELAKPNKNVLATISMSAFDSLKRIAKAGSAEAVQEYFESIHEVMGAHDADWADQFQTKVVQDKGILGAIVGGMTGGALAAVPQAGKFATTAVLGGGTAGVKAIGRSAVRRMTASSYLLLPQEDRDTIAAKYAKDAEVYEATKAQNTTAMTNISKANTVEDLLNLRDPEVLNELDNAFEGGSARRRRATILDESVPLATLAESDEWISTTIDAIKANNPTAVPYTEPELRTGLIEAMDAIYTPEMIGDKLGSLKANAVKRYEALNTANKLALEATRVGDAIYHANTNLYKQTKAAIDKVFPQELREEIVNQALKGADLASSTFNLGVAASKLSNEVVSDKAIKYGNAAIASIAAGKPNKYVRTFTKKQLIALKKGFKNNPTAMKALNKLIEEQAKIRPLFKGIIQNDKEKSTVTNIVETLGGLSKTPIAQKIKAAIDITQDMLFDGVELTHSRRLLKDLEEAKKKDPAAFSKADEKRILKAQKRVKDAIDRNETGLITDVRKRINELYKAATSEDTKKAYQSNLNDLNKYAKAFAERAITAWDATDFEAKFDEIVAKVDEISQNTVTTVDTATEDLKAFVEKTREANKTNQAVVDDTPIQPKVESKKAEQSKTASNETKAEPKAENMAKTEPKVEPEPTSDIGPQKSFYSHLKLEAMTTDDLDENVDAILFTSEDLARVKANKVADKDVIADLVASYTDAQATKKLNPEGYNKLYDLALAAHQAKQGENLNTVAGVPDTGTELFKKDDKTFEEVKTVMKEIFGKDSDVDFTC